MKTIIVLSMFIVGCASVTQQNESIVRNTGYAIDTVPHHARQCETNRCVPLNNSIADNASRGYRGVGVSAAGNIAEGITGVVLSPIINVLKPEDNTPSLEKTYLQ